MIFKDFREGSQGSHQERARFSQQLTGHEVCDLVPLKLLSREDQAKVIESRWVTEPPSGVLKARFIGKGFTQVIDKEGKYVHTPQAITLKMILMTSQLHKRSLAVSDMASAFLNWAARIRHLM